MSGEPFAFAAFRSRQQTTAFEQALKKQGVRCKIINTPHEIGMGCGLSVRFGPTDLKTAMDVSDKLHQSALIGFYNADFTTGKLLFRPATRVSRYNN